MSYYNYLIPVEFQNEKLDISDLFSTINTSISRNVYFSKQNTNTLSLSFQNPLTTQEEIDLNNLMDVYAWKLLYSSDIGESISVSGDSILQTTATTFQDMQSMSISIVTRTKVFIYYSGSSSASSSNKIVSYRITNAEESKVYCSTETEHSNRNNYYNIGFGTIIDGLTPGINVFKVQWKTTGGTAISTVDSSKTRQLSIIILN